MQLQSIPEVNKPIISYIKKGNHKKIGVLIAYKKNNKVYIGYSLCNNKDTWDKDFAKELAIRRAGSWGEKKLPKSFPVPASIKNDFNDFISRCNKYYKDEPLPKWLDLVVFVIYKIKQE